MAKINFMSELLTQRETAAEIHDRWNGKIVKFKGQEWEAIGSRSRPSPQLLLIKKGAESGQLEQQWVPIEHLEK